MRGRFRAPAAGPFRTVLTGAFGKHAESLSTPMNTPTQTESAPAATDQRDVELLRRVAEVSTALRTEVERRIVGQNEVMDGVLTALLAGGHAVLVGVPGLAKTLLIASVADALDLDFSRIQFTPDLMPMDITGTEVIEEDRTTGQRVFRFVKGPIFGNIILADEINRTPPKTQSALLQAMEERSVTAAGQTYRLERPFFVLATQNPIEQEGTYMLPEAQMDRFMFELRIDYPSREEEEEIAARTTGTGLPDLNSVVTKEELVELQDLVRRIPAPPSLVKFAVRLARSTRPEDELAPELIRKYASWGAGPRASQFLILGAKARAAARGSALPTLEDVRSVAPSVLGHRVVLNFEAEADGRTSGDVVRELVEGSETWT